MKWFKVTETLKILKFEEAGQVMSKNKLLSKFFIVLFYQNIFGKVKK